MMDIEKNKIILLGSAILSINPLTCLSSQTRWPEINQIDATYKFSTKNSSGFDLPITDKNGLELYELKCHPMDYNGDPDFDYSGAIDCRLVSKYSEEKVSTLFAESENQSSDWENRGRFLPEHLLNDCATYPDWGAARTFELRGIKLILKLSNIRQENRSNEPKSISFDVIVTAKNAPEATSPLTQPSQIKEPYWFYHPSDGSCHRID